MRRPRSLKAGFLIGSVLWTLGLLGASHMFFVLVAQHFPQVLRVQHWVVLGLLALVFMIGGLAQVRRGLAPVDQLRGRLAAVRDGRSRRIEGDYPAEVQPLVDDLNALIEHREDAVRRAQAKAGHLAHGLKTPLALLSQEAEQVESAGHTELAAGIRQEVDRMRRQIDYHLAHARAAASAAAPGTRSVVAACVEPLVRTMRRLHADRGLSVAIGQLPADLAVAVERQDLDEMIGNLLDNACKWARARVEIHAATSAAHGPGAPFAPLIAIRVVDDGPGLEETVRQAVLGRGVRADEATPGSGLGLAIVRDLAEVYRGSIDLDRGEPGGLIATLRLPGV
ncbi:MAG: HAMP domain-containing histidine kinase [Acidobacteria bacterium]|nr:HAMP domain-containing histidine kinase [Acidobacteriota bacterium]